MTDIMRVLDSGNVMRWHATPNMNHTGQKNSAHTWGVLAVADFLIPELCDVNFFRHALYHDCGEIATGDIPANVKMRNGNLSIIVKDMESDELERMQVKMPPMKIAQKNLLKLSDLFEASVHILKYAIRPNEVEGWDAAIEKMSEIIGDLVGMGHTDLYEKIDFTLNALIRDRNIVDRHGESLQIVPF